MCYLDLSPPVLLRASNDEVPSSLAISGNSAPLHVTPVPCTRSSTSVIRQVFCRFPVSSSWQRLYTQNTVLLIRIRTEASFRITWNCWDKKIKTDMFKCSTENCKRSAYLSFLGPEVCKARPFVCRYLPSRRTFLPESLRSRAVAGSQTCDLFCCPKPKALSLKIITLQEKQKRMPCSVFDKTDAKKKPKYFPCALRSAAASIKKR